MQQTSQAQFGIWLKQQRRSRRLTQEDLAERLVYSSILVKKIEAGERTPSVQLVSLIADWLDIPTDDRLSFLNFARGQLDAQEAEAKFGYAFPARSSSLGNLPTPITPLIGRDEEVETVENLLLSKEVRLLTLTGPPGIGKTSLASEAARRLMGRFRDGVFFVSLALVVDPELVVAAITHALGLPDKSTESLLGNLQQSLSNKQLLLVLDNFEQVLDASPAVLELLGACPDLKVMTTSREALYVQGEQQFHVPALATADPAHLPPIETLPTYPAVALFMKRARAVKPDFALTEENGGAVVAVCARLDGLPLAIELAAGHIRLLSPQEMQARLESRLSLLTGGPRNLPARQQTLRAAIGWSYNLLNKEEQTLFACLGVFVGGFTLSAAEAICNAQGDLSFADSGSGPMRALPFDVPEGIESLLDKNLLKQEEGVDGESRFTMLEMLRDYAVSRLEERGETTVTGRLHTEYYLGLAEAAEPTLRGPDQSNWSERIEHEHDNMRVALRWAVTNGETALGLRLALALWWFWYVRGHITEAGRWLAGSLAQAGAEPSLRASGLFVAGQAAWVQGDYLRAESYLEESLAIFTEVADPLGAGRALRIIANVARDRGDYATSRLYYERSFVATEQAKDIDGMAMVLVSMGENARCENNYGAARSFYERGLEIARSRESRHVTAICLFNLGLVEHHEGHKELAKELFKESLRLGRELGEKIAIADCLFGLGGMARSEMQPDRAVRLLAAADVLFRSTGYQQNRIDRQDSDHELTEARKLVDQLTFERFWGEGQAMTMEQAIDYALDQE